ncbi:Diacylglycerol kinase [Rosistilla carotiformis]|uniref:Diacylglycerol kinase n=1 Tax=Rosistilla carotiformis TaxID=2528017 RepID=A0A518K062_9BACT|nr:diacylglycerol kinase family protein [Rosistilla carotiformis]QDV71192.1 Diacylglycerol kinase [Rosistilla carotiformis]
MSHLLIWNQGSGRAAQIERLRNALDANGTRCVELTRKIDLRSTIEESLRGSGDTVIAAGGDGTVNAIVNALMQIDPPRRPQMAVVPLGTANDFAGTLAIPDDIDQAVGLISSGRSVAIDVIRIRGEGLEQYYANVAAGGNCVRVSEELTDELKSRWGAFSYLRGAIGVLTDMKSFQIAAEIDGVEIKDFDSWAVLVANGKTNAGHIVVAPEASPADGLMDVILIRDGDATDMLEMIAGNLLGNFLECEQILFQKASRLTLRSEPAMRFTLDGEVIEQEPVEFQVMPAAIKMFVGPEFERSNT